MSNKIEAVKLVLASLFEIGEDEYYEDEELVMGFLENSSGEVYSILRDAIILHGMLPSYTKIELDFLSAENEHRILHGQARNNLKRAIAFCENHGMRSPMAKRNLANAISLDARMDKIAFEVYQQALHRVH